MAQKYGKFEMPSSIRVEEASPTFARFVVEPFERGFGHTLGNALRRIMLSSLEAPAIVSCRIEGVPHEFMAVDGIVEDVTDIILNLKGALLRRVTEPSDQEHPREIKLLSKMIDITPEMLDKSGGQCVVTLGDLIGMGDFEAVNPDLRIFTATKPMVRRVDLRVTAGRGYVPSERTVLKDRMVDEIIVDAAFSPVRLVNYLIEATRVGQDTDLDRLILEVTTDGRVTPQEALGFASQIGVLHLDIFERLQTQQLAFEAGVVIEDSDRDAFMAKLALRITEIELSVRSANCLAGADISTIGELVVMSEPDLLKFKNFGKKSLNEIKARLHEMGLGLGMDLNRFGITRENAKTVMANLLGEQAAAEEALEYEDGEFDEPGVESEE
ncbi:MAG: DNA-directed RNA polymerase subunit alpha [Chlamydiia bacterium]